MSDLLYDFKCVNFFQCGFAGTMHAPYLECPRCGGYLMMLGAPVVHWQPIYAEHKIQQEVELLVAEIEDYLAVG